MPSPDVVVHRIGGKSIENLRLKPKEQKLSPPGVSVFTGGRPEDAADQICRAFPLAERLHLAAKTVASASVEAIRQTGFDVIDDPTQRFDNHARLIHADGIEGFTDSNLSELSNILKTTLLE